MQRRVVATAIVLGVVWLGGLPPVAWAQSTERAQQAERLSPTERFAGTVTVKNKAGGTVPVQVSVRNWGISAGREAVKFPSQGFTIVQLHSGRVTTVIDGKRDERKEGDFWTIPAGAQMTIEVGGEAAVLQVVTLRRP